MNSSIKDNPKKRGRPATGKAPMVGVRFHPIEIARIDRWAEQNGVKRATAIRQIVINRLDGDGQ